MRIDSFLFSSHQRSLAEAARKAVFGVEEKAQTTRHRIIDNPFWKQPDGSIATSLKKSFSTIGLLTPLLACTGAQSYDPPFNPNEKAEKQIPPFYGMGMPGYMSRQEVILANNECEDAGMRPRVLYMTMTVLEKKIPVPIDVHCEPKRRQVTSPYFRSSTD